MNKKLIVKFFLFQFTFFALGTLVFIIFFRLNLLISIDTIFYRGIALLLLTCFLMSGLLLFFKAGRYGGLIEYKDVLVCIVLLFSFNLVIFTLLPVTTDRSISVMILKHMDSHKNLSRTANQVENSLDKLLSREKAVEKRLHEQVITGNIKRTPRGYMITSQGSHLVSLFSVIDSIFGIKKQ
jgi:hypothetical protein